MLEIRINIPEGEIQSRITFIKDGRKVSWNELSDSDRHHALYAMKNSDKYYKI